MECGRPIVAFLGTGHRRPTAGRRRGGRGHRPHRSPEAHHRQELGSGPAQPQGGRRRTLYRVRTNRRRQL